MSRRNLFGVRRGKAMKSQRSPRPSPFPKRKAVRDLFSGRRPFRRGFSTVLIGLFIFTIFGFVGFAIDVGRMRLAKAQLQTAPDAAARDAVKGLYEDIDAAQADAVEVAEENFCLGILIDTGLLT